MKERVHSETARQNVMAWTGIGQEHKKQGNTGNIDEDKVPVPSSPSIC